MTLLQGLADSAKRVTPRILLPESSDKRVLEAAVSISRQGFAKVVLLGDKNTLAQSIDQCGGGSLDIGYLDSTDESLRAEYAQLLYQKRKHVGLDLDEARELVQQDCVFAMLALESNAVDGIVTGAITPSQQVLSNALRIIGVAEGAKLVSSFFLMVFDENHQKYGKEILFSDCAMNVNPSAEELAEIATSTIKSANELLGMTPKVAMLSFSTNRSAEFEQVEKVRLATSICQKKALDAEIIGNIQLDAALDDAVLSLKYPETSFIAPANVLIFPTLDAGNIGYKLVQRFSGAEAVGPILQGLAKPVNDLSRGCSVKEIVNTVVITANQCS
ncbi:MAG TPA: phosphate acetyltransferase [Candidatus Thioglobus sp.]|jgi:phosphate acetyltransferase|nr:phosphate acetyltransferase [Candidatus Thioglobus sp.]HIL20178.1 phosphate acetyltransferase [Candidatus Thioglobus sp.]